MGRTIKLVGHTHLRNDRSDAIENHVSVEIDGDAVRLGADAPRPKHLPPIETSDPTVARTLRRWVRQMEATATYHRNRDRPVRSEFKRSKPDLVPAMSSAFDPSGSVFVACPACNGEGYFLCQLCDGEGRVTRRLAAAWRAG